ncbi:dehydrogenase [Sediminibacterium sp. KACHI17]|uniref:Dehydrogenase n=1 Tax=Sediminibacterium sp. KACHI17 TaxID=1751071 RepID=A0AAT9GIM3_9BACT
MKVLIEGLGSIGRKHVDAILSLNPRADIYAIRTTKDAPIYRSVKNIYNYSELPSNIDFGIISNITSEHENSIIEMIKRRLPLFIEKPVISDVSGASKIQSLLDEYGLTTYVACNMRFHPAIKFLKKYLSESVVRINEVNIYCGSYLPEWRPNKDFRKIYSANVEMGGGVHLDLIHELDYCTWIFGFPISVIAEKRSVSSLKISSVDSAHFILKYPEYSTSIVLNYFRRDAKRTIEIVAEEFTIFVNLLSNSVVLSSSNIPLFKSDFNMVDTYKEQMKYFINDVLPSNTSINDFTNAIKVLTIANHANS